MRKKKTNKNDKDRGAKKERRVNNRKSNADMTLRKKSKGNGLIRKVGMDSLRVVIGLEGEGKGWM